MSPRFDIEVQDVCLEQVEYDWELARLEGDLEDLLIDPDFDLMY